MVHEIRSGLQNLRRLRPLRPSISTMEKLNAPPLRGTATVVRQGGDVFDRPDHDAGRLQTSDRALAARTRALHADLEFFHPELRRPLGARLGRTLGSKGRALAAS